MVRKILISAVLAGATLVASGCHHKVQNPLANIDSKQPDKGLFDRGMDSMKHARYQEARTLLETLINTYPDSEYIARAKLALGDAWYNEGGKAAWAQAEAQYKDFQTFFPNLPEASEAQLKIASMHYREMEKPDRDYTEAQRASDEYKLMIQQYPDSPLLPQAKQKLREVQEILAERQFRIANFYYLRVNLAAAQARLESLTQSYPLYSGSDEAFFELGNLYEKEAAGVRQQKRITDAQRERVSAQLEKKAIEAYSTIVTRYAATDRVGDAKGRLKALNAPIPEPTPEQLAQSKAEEASRQKVKLMAKMSGDFKKHPNVGPASKVGEPNLQEETVTNAATIIKDMTNQMIGMPATNASVKVEGSGTGTPPANESAPGTTQGSPGTESLAPIGTGTGPLPANEKAPGTADTTTTEGTAPTPAPAQVNDIQKPADGTQASATATPATTADSKAAPVDPKQESSSKKKGKKGLRKLIPF